MPRPLLNRPRLFGRNLYLPLLCGVAPETRPELSNQILARTDKIASELTASSAWIHMVLNTSSTFASKRQQINVVPVPSEGGKQVGSSRGAMLSNLPSTYTFFQTGNPHPGCEAGGGRLQRTAYDPYSKYL
jgi:hypothetical protein